ncbi:MAG: hypothetical protein ACREQ5_12990, partial [Candidatus Dormibacteria bacterium]
MLVVNTKAATYAANNYTVYNPALPVALSAGGGVVNVSFQGDSAQTSGLGSCIVLNAANGFVVRDATFTGFLLENVSLWDCYACEVENTQSTASSIHVGFHRACYDNSVIAASVSGTTSFSSVVYAEQFTIDSQTLTYTPLFTKFVEFHHYTTTTLNAGIDLGGPAYVNLTGVTADNIVLVFPYQLETRLGSVPYQILSDVGAQNTG